MRDLFIDKKVPYLDRHRTPIILNSIGQVVWVVGFPPAEAKKLFWKTKKALRLTYERL